MEKPPARDSIAIPAIAIAAGTGLAACGSNSAPAAKAAVASSSAPAATHSAKAAAAPTAPVVLLTFTGHGNESTPNSAATGGSGGRALPSGKHTANTGPRPPARYRVDSGTLTRRLQRG